MKSRATRTAWSWTEAPRAGRMGQLLEEDDGPVDEEEEKFLADHGSSKWSV